MSDKIYIQLFDNLPVWVPTNAERLSSNEYLILPDNEFNPTDFLNLCEFIPGDIVTVEENEFQDGQKGCVGKSLIKPSTHPDKKFFEFLFRTAIKQIEISRETYLNYESEIEKIVQLEKSGKDFYDITLTLIGQLKKLSTE